MQIGSDASTRNRHRIFLWGPVQAWQGIGIGLVGKCLFPLPATGVYWDRLSLSLLGLYDETQLLGSLSHVAKIFFSLFIPNY